jgi:mRNA interferase MazF
MNKDFDQWNELKKKLDSRNKYPSFKEKQIWWLNLGLNIGDEQCGKGIRSVRPVLILKKFNDHFFFGIPLSSIQKDNKYYFNFEFKGKKQSAIICQIKCFSAKRICDLYGELNDKIFNCIRKKAGNLLNLS